MNKLGAWKGVVILVLVYSLLAAVSPDAVRRAMGASQGYLVEMVLIIPAVVILMGLFEVWVPRDMIRRFLGRKAGGRGVFLAFLMGTAPTGPLYVAFPIASSLMKKGASPSNLIVFLGAWAAAKVPQIAMEAKFLGPDFAMARLGLTAISLVIMGFFGETLLRKLDADQPRKEGDLT